MATSDNLLITLLEQSQNQKYVTVNEAIIQIDNAFNAAGTVDGLVGDTYVDASTFTNAFFLTLEDATTSPNLTGSFDVIIPETPRFFAVYNTTAFTATIRTGVSAGQTETVLAGQRAFMYSDGTDIFSLGVLTRFTMSAFFSGKPVGGQTVLILLATVPFTMKQFLEGSLAYAEIAPADGDAIFTLYKNAGSIGTVTFPNGSNDGVFSFASDVAFAAGDRFSITAPNPADSTMESISFTFEGVRN